ncbi:MAG: energy-coupling factor transporter ATPase [Erysipelotrichaceae bacterium]|nr:energy-coupling factor transporter ATPase [Erysipelotrichaceae bacterium]
MAITFEQVDFIYFPKTPFEHLALKDVNVTFEDGKFYGVVGHTGSGKSTLVQHINALLLPTKGKVKVNGLEIINNKKSVDFKKIRKTCGLVFQFPEYQLFEETVLKDVMFGPKNFKFSEDDSLRFAKEALQTVGIDESLFDKSPFDLSGGQKRRVAIAGILAMNPDVIILDEPTAGLDPVGSKEIMDIFKILNEKGKTIILITHDMNVVYEYCNKVVVMSNGEIVYQGSKNELFDDKEKLSSFALKEPDLIRFKSLLAEKGVNFEKKETYDLDFLISNLLREVKR